MAIEIQSIGHCAIGVADLDGTERFYTDVLGFSRLEKDPDHGGVFLSLPGTSHTIDLFPAGEMGSGRLANVAAIAPSSEVQWPGRTDPVPCRVSRVAR